MPNAALTDDVVDRIRTELSRSDRRSMTLIAEEIGMTKNALIGFLNRAGIRSPHPPAVTFDGTVDRITVAPRKRPSEAGWKKKPQPMIAGNRPCLCCGHVFRSEGAHNRMCNPCRATQREYA